MKGKRLRRRLRRGMPEDRTIEGDLNVFRARIEATEAQGKDVTTMRLKLLEAETNISQGRPR